MLIIKTFLQQVHCLRNRNLISPRSSRPSSQEPTSDSRRASCRTSRTCVCRRRRPTRRSSTRHTSPGTSGRRPPSPHTPCPTQSRPPSSRASSRSTSTTRISSGLPRARILLMLPSSLRTSPLLIRGALLSLALFGRGLGFDLGEVRGGAAPGWVQD